MFGVVPFQESRQLGIAEHTVENSGLGALSLQALGVSKRKKARY